MNKRNLLTLSLCFFALFNASAQEIFNKSDSKEYGISISNDGKTAVFFSEKGKSKQVLMSVRNSSEATWGVPAAIEVLSEKISNGKKISHLTLSGDGNLLYFSANLFDSKGDEDIYYSQRNGNEWAEPVNVGDPINTALYEGQPCLVADGTKLAFVRDNFNKTPNGGQCYAIWLTEGYKNGNWGTPHKLPEPINLDCEQSPFLMNDGNSIIFGSIREGGQGGFDFHQSELQANGKWTLPVNMSFLNTAQNEERIALFGRNEAIYTSNGKDIIKVELPVLFRSSSFVALSGRISSNAGSVSGATITATNIDNSSNVVKTNSNEYGVYTLRLKKGNEYVFQVESPNYEMQERNVGIGNNENGQENFILVSNVKVVAPVIIEQKPKEVVKNLQLPQEVQTKPVPTPALSPKKEEFFLKSDPTVVYKKDTVYTINDIYFDVNSATIRFDSYLETTRIYELMRDNTAIKVQLSGYSNSYGDAKYNQQLSERRAKAVKDYLISIGVDEKRLNVYGFGESELVLDKRGKEDSAKSRRVRFIIY